MKKLFIILFLFSSIVWGQIQNPGFEDGTTHWTGDTHLSISSETTKKHGGSKSLDCTFDSQTQAQCDLRSDLITGISGNTSYTVSAWFYDNDAAGRANLVIEWYDKDNAYISTSYYQTYTTDQDSWQKLEYTVTSPADAASCKVGSRFYDVSNNWDGNCTIYVDDFDGSPSPLPVELSSFTAKVNNGKVELKWQTATEVNNYGFQVERANGDSDWEKIGFVEGHGNSNSPKSYSFTDVVNGSGKYSYRLKQIDVDGSFEYSNVVEVTVTTANKFELLQNYPNPFNPTTTLRFTLAKETPVNITVYNYLGQKVVQVLNKTLSAGTHTVNFNASKLAGGVYFYRMRAGNFSSTKKMILLK